MDNDRSVKILCDVLDKCVVYNDLMQVENLILSYIRPEITPLSSRKKDEIPNFTERL